MTNKQQNYPLSFSKIKTFFSCMAQYSYLYLSKKVEFKDTKETLEGKKRHEDLERYCKGEKTRVTLDPRDQIWAEKVIKAPGEKFYEKQFSLSSDMKHYNDKFIHQVRMANIPPTIANGINGIIDVQIVNNNVATVIDYKTGKPFSYQEKDEFLRPIKDYSAQLNLYAIYTFLKYPYVQKVKGILIWLNHGTTTEKIYLRSDLKSLQEEVKEHYDYARTILINNDSDHIEANFASPSKLCNWCPAKEICPKAFKG